MLLDLGLNINTKDYRGKTIVVRRNYTDWQLFDIKWWKNIV